MTKVPKKTKKPLVSVVVLNWNGKHLLDPCLKALTKQSYPNIELLVVDNGSSDGSSDYIRKKYPEFIIVQNETNLGFSGGVNAGIRAAKGKYVALLNNDAQTDKDWILYLVKCFLADQQAGIVAPKMLKVKKREDIPQKKLLIDTAGDCMSKWGVPFPRGRDQKDRGQYDVAEETFGACGGASLYSQKMFDDIGLFDEDFFAYYEDADVAFRARLAGYKVYYQPKSVVYHLVGGTNSKRGHFTHYMSMKNMNFLYLKNMPLKLFIKYLPRFFFTNLFLFGVSIKNGAVWHALKAYLVSLLYFPKMLFKRWKIQRTRLVSSREIDKQLSNSWPFSRRFIGRFVGVDKT